LCFGWMERPSRTRLHAWTAVLEVSAEWPLVARVAQVGSWRMAAEARRAAPVGQGAVLPWTLRQPETHRGRAAAQVEADQARRVLVDRSW
jgi:hypothetical protein